MQFRKFKHINEIRKGPKWTNQVKSRPMKLQKFKWANEVEN